MMHLVSKCFGNPFFFVPSAVCSVFRLKGFKVILSVCSMSADILWSSSNCVNPRLTPVFIIKGKVQQNNWKFSLCLLMQSQAKFRRPQNISGASQPNRVASFLLNSWSRWGLVLRGEKQTKKKTANDKKKHYNNSIQLALSNPSTQKPWDPGMSLTACQGSK